MLPQQEIFQLLERFWVRQYPDCYITPWILVDISHQCLCLIESARVLRSYPISTSARGPGNRYGSGQTPTGVFRIAEKHGQGMSAGRVFIGRKATEHIAPIPPIRVGSDLPGEADCITSRILWLDGLQEGINQGGVVDTFLRYIYIHGTNQETWIGRAVSHGCVRMRNVDVIELFDLVSEQSLVCIGREGVSCVSSMTALEIVKAFR